MSGDCAGAAHAVSRVVVVVPARDEEELLPACLDSVDAARTALGRRRPDVEVVVVVVLDRCTDGTAGVVAARRHVRGLWSDTGVVGAARAAGVSAALGDVHAGSLSTTWISCTDADTTVPAQWLWRQVELAEAGADLVTGTVVPTDLPGGLFGRWRARHVLGEGHPHVHGANLGVRADAYLAAGGFPPEPVHEDVLLVEAVRTAGHRWVATDTTRVATSSRSAGRVVGGGFSGYLRRLAAEVPALPSGDLPGMEPAPLPERG
ncbi:glycosyltransferase [Pedococcus sp. NPDC057267]|uniref:glycosyltransferase n=1 Tax=Pedococcus sp. NPDC057267 TaxID=3346077 RepID=UPI003631B119